MIDREKHPMNPELKAEVEGLRSGIFATVTGRASGLPEHYTVESVPDEPCALITNHQTLVRLKVGLCNLTGALEAIEAFGS